jgi:hypothetical protein
MRGNHLQQPSPDSRDTIEVFQAAERPVRRPIGQDDLGQPGTDLGKPRELLSARSINVDPLAGIERAFLPHGAIALSQRRTRRQRCQQLNLTRRLTRAGEHIPHALPRNCQGEQEQQRALFRRRHERR